MRAKWMGYLQLLLVQQHTFDSASVLSEVRGEQSTWRAGHMASRARDERGTTPHAWSHPPPLPPTVYRGCFQL